MKKTLALLYPIALLASSTFDDELFTWSRTFAELMHLVNTHYYITVSPQEAMCKAMNAFVSFDPHSKFLDPKAYQNIKNVTNGQFFGIGVLLSPKEPHDAIITVSDCILHGPAHTAGIKSGDMIIALDNSPVLGLTVDEITEKIKGAQGTIVQVTLLRKGKTIEIPVKRDTIKDYDAQAYYFTDQKVAYIAIHTFTSNSAQQLEKVLLYAQNNNASGIIIDLRDNTGGLLQAAVDCASLFVPEKTTIVYTKNKDQKIIETFATARKPLNLGTMPIFILVNHHTASAAEIFAGTFKRHPSLYTFLLGTQTFGKGSVQPVFPLSNGCAVKLTHALYYLANGVSIQGVGIEPDFVIEKKVTEQSPGLNSLLDSESKLPKSIQPAKKQKKKNEEPQKALLQDYQVHVTLSLINVLVLAHTNAQLDLTTPQKAYTYLFQHQPFTDTLDVEEIML